MADVIAQQNNAQVWCCLVTKLHLAFQINRNISEPELDWKGEHPTNL